MPDDHSPNEPHDGEFKGRTYLYIRTNPADQGAEPLAAGLPFWTSPDIVIVKPGGVVGGEAVPLQPNEVRVTVTNAGGIPAVDALVETFVADPSTVITPATATPIGADYVTVQGYNTATRAFPWTPQAADSGHRCIVARVSLVVPPDTYLNPAVFDVVGDRHVAQRNIIVLEVAQGQAMTFQFKLGTTGARQQRFILRAVERTAELDLRAVAAMGGCVGGMPATSPLAALDVRMLSARVVRERPSLTYTPRQPVGVVRRAEAALDRREVAMRLDADGPPRLGAVTFQVPERDQAGELHIVDVIQVDESTGAVNGGLTFIVRVV